MKRKTDCEELKVEWDASNFIALCRTDDDEEGTCHSLFDNFQMSLFVHGDDIGGWRVVGGKPEYREKLVNLATNPPKQALHSHSARCVLNKSLLLDDDDENSYELDVSDDMEEHSDCYSDDGSHRENIMGGFFYSGSGSSGGNISLLYSVVCFTVGVTSVAMYHVTPVSNMPLRCLPI